jgi:hypothetical protein
MPGIVITTSAERPEYLERMYEFADTWPKFMFNDPIGNALMGQVAANFPEQCLVATEDGLPEDPWLRVHVKAGGKIIEVAPRSMVIAGTLDEWREWTGLPFDTTGDVVVPKALVPVHCDVRHNHAVYVEPNVWVRHDL